MSRTKEKILKEALLLFNEYGVANVSLRDIAKESNISIGNLQYHFKKREAITETLYFQLVERMNEVFIMNDSNILNSVFQSYHRIIQVAFEFRFFFLDFVMIVRNNEEIRRHYRSLSRLREEQFFALIDVLQKFGLLRQELISNEYFSLFKRNEILSNFVLSSILIHRNKISKKSLKDLSDTICKSIFPYLTEKGREEYYQFFPHQVLH